VHRSGATFVDAAERVAEREDEAGLGRRRRRVLWYCSAPPPFFIFLHRPSWPPRSQCSRWQASLQYLVLHLLHLFL
jgi:hypothetical protein